jgi:hypothetical protein
VAEHLGTDHHELRVSPREAIDAIPACRSIATSRSPTARRCRPTCCASWRAVMSRWRCRVTAATSCSPATRATARPRTSPAPSGPSPSLRRPWPAPSAACPRLGG